MATLESPLKVELPKEIREYFRKQGSKGGKIGSKRRLEKLTAEERSAIAKKAAQARWKRRVKIYDRFD